MSTPSPATYISLSPLSNNYALLYGRRLKQGLPTGGESSSMCTGTLRNDRWKLQGTTSFTKLRLNTTSMTIVQDDFTFSRSSGKAVRYGWAGDCYSRTTNCPRGSFLVNLTDSGVRLAGEVEWYTKGSDVAANVFQWQNRHLIHALCGGWCGQCRLKDIKVEPEKCPAEAWSASLVKDQQLISSIHQEPLLRSHISTRDSDDFLGICVDCSFSSSRNPTMQTHVLESGHFSIKFDRGCKYFLILNQHFTTLNGAKGKLCSNIAWFFCDWNNVVIVSLHPPLCLKFGTCSLAKQGVTSYYNWFLTAKAGGWYYDLDKLGGYFLLC